MAPIPGKFLKEGLESARSLMTQQDKIWSKYSSDKVDIGETLAHIIRTLSKAFPLAKALHALSIGSSNEPQFRILQSTFQGGLYLLDIDREALEIIQERTARQRTHNVHPIRGDFDKLFLGSEQARYFSKFGLTKNKMELIALQHSLYYCPKKDWGKFLRNLYRHVLAPQGALYAVLMSAESRDPSTTTWLYNHFAGKFCSHTNDQDLLEFKKELEREPCFRNAEIKARTSRVSFMTDRFDKFMAVVWMILLYPQVHRYTLSERREITEYCYEHFFRKQKPLIQLQDHLVIYRGLPIKGIV